MDHRKLRAPRIMDDMPKSPDTLYFPLPESIIRIRGGAHGLHGMLSQLTFRCGKCGNPVAGTDLERHHDEHTAGLA